MAREDVSESDAACTSLWDTSIRDIVLGLATGPAASTRGLRGEPPVLACMSTDTDGCFSGREGTGGTGGMALIEPGPENVEKDAVVDVLRGGRARDEGLEVALVLGEGFTGEGEGSSMSMLIFMS